MQNTKALEIAEQVLQDNAKTQTKLAIVGDLAPLCPATYVCP